SSEGFGGAGPKGTGVANRRRDGEERRRAAGSRAAAFRGGARHRRGYRRHRRFRRRARAGRDLHGRARGYRIPAGSDWRRDVARCPGVDRPPGGELHGLPVRRLGDPGREVLRDGFGAAARARPGRKGALCETRLRGTGGARRARARDAHAAHRRSRQLGRAEGGARAVAAHAELAELAPKIPASASKDYGTPFYDIFKRYDSDFYKIDPLLFSPAEVWLTSVQSGKTYHAGHVNPEVLRASLLES